MEVCINRGTPNSWMVYNGKSIELGVPPWLRKPPCATPLFTKSVPYKPPVSRALPGKHQMSQKHQVLRVWALHFTNVSTCYLVKRLTLERLEKSVSHDTRRHNGPGKIRKKINRTAATSISSAPLTMCMCSSTASACDSSDPMTQNYPSPQHPNWDSGVNDLGQHVPRSRGHWMPLLHHLNRMAKRTLTWLVASGCFTQNVGPKKPEWLKYSKIRMIWVTPPDLKKPPNEPKSVAENGTYIRKAHPLERLPWLHLKKGSHWHSWGMATLPAIPTVFSHR